MPLIFLFGRMGGVLWGRGGGGGGMLLFLIGGGEVGIEVSVDLVRTFGRRTGGGGGRIQDEF